ncbi:hypothetical protein GCM10010245_92030 [Streptomyces spectabilis]|uniref:hypothetical protein n=1 Tax=Streptomyces spectabilis TaxID=68270 RepID=UPI001994C491|nr:hypothetical protein [Streptomyces spectabilis]GGV58880.1 hypothetical protein GCM10010245_92030 [Streptomyces spectabilis]
MPGIDDVLSAAMGIPGALGASLVDWTSGLSLGTAGLGPHDDHETAAADTAEVAQPLARNSTFAPPGVSVGSAPANGQTTGTGPEDVIVTTGDHYHLMRFVTTDFDSRTYLYLWLDRRQANLAIARRRLGCLALGLVAE